MSFLIRLLAPISPTAALRRALRLAEQGDVKQAFPLLSRAARAGIAEAEYRVGRCYLEGTGVPPSRSEGARWLERAANQGYVEAQAQLATLAIHGLIGRSEAVPGTRLFAPTEASEPDFETSLRWARKAADGGSEDGQDRRQREAREGDEDDVVAGPFGARDPHRSFRSAMRVMLQPSRLSRWIVSMRAMVSSGK